MSAPKRDAGDYLRGSYRDRLLTETAGGTMFYRPDALYINLSTGKIGDGGYWNKKIFEIFTKYRPRGRDTDLKIRDLGVDIEELYDFLDDE